MDRVFEAIWTNGSPCRPVPNGVPIAVPVPVRIYSDGDRDGDGDARGAAEGRPPGVFPQDMGRVWKCEIN